MVAIERCSELLLSGTAKSTDEVLEAVALLVGTLGGSYRMPVQGPASDTVLRELHVILEPAHVKVRRTAIVRADNLGVGDGLLFEHVPPMRVAR